MMGISFFSIPYQIQPQKPINIKMYMPRLTLSAFFSLIIFTSCGTNDADVKTPEAIPMICV